MKYITWDGKYVVSEKVSVYQRIAHPLLSTSLPITDSEESVFMICGGTDPLVFAGVQEAASQALEAAQPCLRISKKDRKHSRGKFPARNVGISHGGGQTHPGILHCEASEVEALESLRKNEAFRQLAGHQSGKYMCLRKIYAIGLMKSSYSSDMGTPSPFLLCRPPTAALGPRQNPPSKLQQQCICRLLLQLWPANCLLLPQRPRQPYLWLMCHHLPRLL